MVGRIDGSILTTDLEDRHIPFLALDPDDIPQDETSVERTKAWMRDLLRRFENRYGMTSQEFYARWLQDGIEDTYETTFWASLCRYLQWADT